MNLGVLSADKALTSSDTFIYHVHVHLYGIVQRAGRSSSYCCRAQIAQLLGFTVFYFIMYTFMAAPLLHKGLWSIVGHLVHTIAT